MEINKIRNMLVVVMAMVPYLKSTSESKQPLHIFFKPLEYVYIHVMDMDVSRQNA